MIFPATYFPPVLFWTVWKQSGRIGIEAHEHYQKGSFRNRMHINDPTGFLPLSVPLLKGKNNQMPVTEVRIDNTQNWQRKHWRALETAYGKSPFFEHYQDELSPLFHRRYERLFELNLDTIKVVAELLQFDFQTLILTEKYKNRPEDEDFRHKMKVKSRINHSFARYVQVFSAQAGFVPNLSILDLLFCTGPEAVRYL